jgi:hypothetical protein
MQRPPRRRLGVDMNADAGAGRCRGRPPPSSRCQQGTMSTQSCCCLRRDGLPHARVRPRDGRPTTNGCCWVRQISGSGEEQAPAWKLASRLQARNRFRGLGHGQVGGMGSQRHGAWITTTRGGAEVLWARHRPGANL